MVAVDLGDQPLPEYLPNLQFLTREPRPIHNNYTQVYAITGSKYETIVSHIKRPTRLPVQTDLKHARYHFS